MNGRKKIQKRGFLNDDKALTAFYMVDVEYTTLKDFNRKLKDEAFTAVNLSFDGELKIADCAKIINLEFFIFRPVLGQNKKANHKNIKETKKIIREKQDKVRKLKEALDLLTTSLSEYYDVIDSIDVDEVTCILKERKKDEEGEST